MTENLTARLRDETDAEIDHSLLSRPVEDVLASLHAGATSTSTDRRRVPLLAAVAVTAGILALPTVNAVRGPSPGTNGGSRPASDVAAGAATESAPGRGVLPTYRFKEGATIFTEDVLRGGVLRFTSDGCPFVEIGKRISQPVAFPPSFEMVETERGRQVVGGSGNVWAVEGERVNFGALPPQPGWTGFENLCGAPDTNGLGVLAVQPVWLTDGRPDPAKEAW